MSELYLEWEELVEAGECAEDFESWYSGRVDRAAERWEGERWTRSR